MSEVFEHQIRAARPTNFGRILTSLIFLIISYIFSIEFIKWIAIIHVIIGLAWMYLIENHYRVYVENPGYWYLNSAIDLVTLTIFIYITGTTHSFLIVGYIVVTTLSSMDLNRKRGLFAVVTGIILYIICSIMVYLDLFPYINILTGKTESVTIFGLIVSILISSMGNIIVNLVIFTIYNKLNDSNIELKKQFEEIRKLKFQQDGDYYLTSLLLEPLLSSHINSENIRIEQYISQYKKFHFQNREREIGGDIIMYEKIILGDQIFSAFINGDAMGKSIQGAGGALVLGVLFKSILRRMKKEISLKTPESWILLTYQEIQDSFESFDGFMLVSAIIGLVNERTGELYYLNLEHPQPVLYRDGKAILLEISGYFPKLGTPILKKPNKIEKLDLVKGDVFFVGSDGKDDIKLLENGVHEVYNQDDTLFLKIIEECRGDLSKITVRYKDYGKIIDDFSILKIEFV